MRLVESVNNVHYVPCAHYGVLAVMSSIRLSMNDPERNIDTMRRAFEALNSRDLHACTDLMTSDFIINIAEMPYPKRGLSAWRKHAETLFAAFPDARVEIEDIFAVDDKLAVRVRMTGTHKGEFLGTKPTGKRIEYQSHEIYRFEEGKLAEEWICSDMMTLFIQIGALSKGQIISMWLSRFRFWFGLVIGGTAGVLVMAFASGV